MRRSAVYLIGEAAPELRRALTGRGIELVDGGTLERAVRLAASVACDGDVVLLSPACASYDQFSDYEQRGERFRAARGGAHVRRSRPEARGAEQLLVIVAMALVAFGVVMVYSASASPAPARAPRGLRRDRPRCALACLPGRDYRHIAALAPSMLVVAALLLRARARGRRSAQRRAALAEPARRLHAAALGAGQGRALRLRRGRALDSPAGAARLARGHAPGRRRRRRALRPGRGERPRLGDRPRAGRRGRADRKRRRGRCARAARARGGCAGRAR